tara:strand:- start:13635 stop:14600 length:966 start_codon:yes stop_codon:yes gene_type:complete
MKIDGYQKVSEDTLKNNNIATAYKNYLDDIAKDPVYNVWYDLNSKICFGLDTNYFSKNASEASVLTDKSNFLFDDRHGAASISSVYSELFEKVSCDQEMVISNKSSYDKYRNSKILIIGGGPSTRGCRYKIDDYDYVWSCNNYHKSELIKNTKIDLVNLGGEVDLLNRGLIERLVGEETQVIFDAKISRNSSNLKSFVLQNKQIESGFYVTRYFGKVGTIPRMVVLATLLGAKEISFIGMDATPPTKDCPHAFEPDKPPIGPSNNYYLAKRQKIMLWDYLLNVISHKNKNVIYKNLGSCYENNLTAFIQSDRIIQSGVSSG